MNEFQRLIDEFIGKLEILLKKCELAILPDLTIKKYIHEYKKLLGLEEDTDETK